MSEQLTGERASAAPASGQVGGRAVMLIPHREPGVEETMLPPAYRRILAAVRQTAGPVMTRQVGEMLGVDVSVWARLEPLRGKLVGLTDRGWLRKLTDGRFTTRLRAVTQPSEWLGFTSMGSDGAGAWCGCQRCPVAGALRRLRSRP